MLTGLPWVDAAAASPAVESEIARHVEKAEAFAGGDLKTPLFLCRPDSLTVVRDTLATGSREWLAPTRVFDNIFYIGNRFVGVFVIKTSAYRTSGQRFARISRDAGAVGLLNTHVFGDGGLDRLAAAQARKPGQPNPFVLGPDPVRRYYALLDECLQAAELRLGATAP